MVALSPLLTILAVAVIFDMTLLPERSVGTVKYFVSQQMSLADVTGFVEERMNGQRVVKVFNHERKSEEEFDKLKRSSLKALPEQILCKYDGTGNRNIGNLQFVLQQFWRQFPFWRFVIGVGGITLGVMASYLQFTKSFTQPFMQVAYSLTPLLWRLQEQSVFSS